MKLLTRAQFLVLAALARCPMHPYAIRQEVIELADHKYWPSHSTIQQAVKALLAAGLIEECGSNPHYWLRARRSVPYELTKQGRKRLDGEIDVQFRLCQMVRMWRHRHRQQSTGR